MKKFLSFIFAAFCSITCSQKLQLLNLQNNNSLAKEETMLVEKPIGMQARRNANSGNNSLGGAPSTDIAFEYFSKLLNNYGVNDKGSCPFVATEMLLSYYDTFYNDFIIPSNYESAPAPIESLDFRTAEISPGTKIPAIPFDLAHGTYKDYCDYIQDYKNESFHFKLLSYIFSPFDRYTITDPFTNIINQKTGDKNFPVMLTTIVAIIHQLCCDNPRINFSDLNMNIDQINVSNIIDSGGDNPTLIDLLNIVFTNNYDEEAVVEALKQESNIVKSKIKTIVSSGTPVVVEAAPDFDSIKGTNGLFSHPMHAFVVYGYDSATNTFHCHPGWNDNAYRGEGDGLVHNADVDLLNSSYCYPLQILYLEPTLQHICSDHYTVNNFSVCPCETNLFAADTMTSSELYWDSTPTLSWNSVCNVNYYEHMGMSYTLSAIDANDLEIFSKSGITGNKYRLRKSEYKQLLSNLRTDSFTFVLKLYNGVFYTTQCTLQCHKPTLWLERIQIKPIDWSSSWDRGLFSVPNNTISEIQTINGMTLATTRKRVWRDGGWIVIQPKNTNNNSAVLEINFEKHVTAFMYSIALRSSSESCGQIKVEVKDSNGSWSEIENISSSSLPSVQTGQPRRFIWVDIPTVSFPNITSPKYKNIRAIRFTNTCKNRNAGAMCLDDLVFDDTAITISNALSYGDTWITQYGKSCLPNNIPTSGNPVPFNPINPPEIGVIGSK